MVLFSRIGFLSVKFRYQCQSFKTSTIRDSSWLSWSIDLGHGVNGGNFIRFSKVRFCSSISQPGDSSLDRGRLLVLFSSSQFLWGNSMLDWNLLTMRFRFEPWKHAGYRNVHCSTLLFRGLLNANNCSLVGYFIRSKVRKKPKIRRI